MIDIVTREEYEYAVSRNYEPLTCWCKFKMDIRLRIQIQNDIFGSGDIEKQNQKFYRWCWENKPHYCEETAKPLYGYSAKFISHIISRGADRRMALDPRNVNILSLEMHMKWESAKNKDMNIYRVNQHIIQLLKSDYNL